MSNEIINFLGDHLKDAAWAALSGVIIYYLKKIMTQLNENKKHAPLTVHNLELYGKICAKVAEIRYKTDAARAYIMSIRNGEIQINNLHQYKIYRDYEDLEDGVSSQKEIQQGLHVQDMFDVVKSYYGTVQPPSGINRLERTCKTCGGLTLKYIVEDLDISYVKSLFKEAGVKLAYHAVIYDNTTKLPVGLLGIDFCSDKHSSIAISKEDMIHIELCNTAREIEQIIKHDK